MIIDGHTLPYYFADGFVNPQRKPLLLLFGSMMTIA